MNRRQFLAGVGAGVAVTTAGCTIGATPDRTPPPAERTAVDETWAAGPTEPNCDASGEAQYPFMNRKDETVPAVPVDNDLATVEAFVQERIEFEGEVILQERKPERVAWRSQEFDVSERFGSELYYVGWVKEVDGPHRLLVVIGEDGTRIVNFIHKDCPGD